MLNPSLLRRLTLLLGLTLASGVGIGLLLWALAPAALVEADLTDPLEWAWSSAPSDNSRAAAWGDYDNDGDLDLAIGNVSSKPSRLYRNDNGVLNPNPVWSSATLTDVYDLAWGDYDNDGDLDLAAAIDCTCSFLQIYRNQTGTLTTNPVYLSATGVRARTLSWGDVDKDGDLDLAVGGTTVAPRIFINNAFSFTAYAAYTLTNADSGRAVAWGDVDNDGDLDLAVAQNNLKIFPNLGTSLRLTPTYTATTTHLAFAVVWGDYNKDGKLDLALNGQNGAYVYSNTGTMLGNLYAWNGTGAGSSGIAWGDVDNDNDLDLIAATSVFANQNGVLSPTTPLWSSPIPDSVSDNAIGDVDGDGDVDLASANAGSPARVYHANGSPIAPTGVWSSTTTPNTRALAWVDVDRDGDLDLAVSNYSEPLYLFRNTGTTLATTPFYTSALSDRAEDMSWGDMDGDGDLDLAIANNNLGQTAARIYLNTGVTLPVTANWSASILSPTNSVAWGDVDNDGDLDLALGLYDAPSRVYRNNGVSGGVPQMALLWTSTENHYGNDIAWGDMDNDGDLDLAVATACDGFQNNCQPNYVYRNEGGFLTPSAVWASTETDKTYDLAWGDLDGDGDLDLVVGNNTEPSRAYRNDDGVLTPSAIWSSVESEGITAIALVDYDGDGDLDLATSGGASPLRLYRNDPSGLTWMSIWAATSGNPQSMAWGDVDKDGDLDVALGHASSPMLLHLNQRDGRSNLRSVPLVRLVRPTPPGDADFYSSASIRSGIVPITYTLSDPYSLSVRLLRGYYSTNGGGDWLLATPTGTITTNLTTTIAGVTRVFNWDVNNSGFFGQSDNVVFRLVATPAIVSQTTRLPGPYLFGSYAAQTFPFRVRGTQVRVLSNTTPVANAIVFRLPPGQTAGGDALADLAGIPFRTDAQGYLQGRGTINTGDRLMALLPITATQSYTLYFTSGTPQIDGVLAYTVTTRGVQTLTVSSAHPLLLFNVDVSLEWDAHNEIAYLGELQANLQRVSEYLYDFTDGQAALGHVNVFQNADEWSYAHVAVQVNNRLRPFAFQGGVVFTPTEDPLIPGFFYNPGQVTMGSVWNRYGTPGQSLGDDWSIILAHELSHYLFYHDDTYLGMDVNGSLIPVATCVGSAMADLYDRPENTEFIANEALWQANCAETLPERTLQRNEWETMRLWYPALVSPTVINPGPSLMPFDFTGVDVFDPYTPTATLVDPTFYINYTNSGPSSAEARAYLLRSNYVYNLGAPFGGQNRVIARGATPGDRLCVFDRARDQFGCETIESGDAELNLEYDPTWRPILNMIPVNSTTLSITVSNIITGLSLRARLYPDLGTAFPAITLTYANLKYSGVFTLEDVSLSGNIQFWVNETSTELNPRREALSAYSIGGNPGALRVGGGATRGGGGALRVGGGALRVGGGALRVGGAPVVSPDGQMIFFAEDPTDFITGTFFMIQEMPGLPTLPPGRVVVGRGYELVESPGVTLPVGSISIQYLSNEVSVAGASENDLRLYFWDGTTWNALPTNVDQYFNLATAPSEGAGVYALLASVELPLAQLGWNAIGYPVPTRPITTALASIDGAYTMVYQYVATDTVDPWKLFVPNGVPTYVVDLYTMEFGQAYWIYATMTTTLYLAPSAPTTGATTLPPSTFYGALTGNAFFTPLPGQTLTAWVDGVLCGQTQTQAFNGDVVYAIDVTNSTYCNVPNRAIVFRLGAQLLGPTGQWNNTQVNQLNLSSPMLYLPMVMK